MPTKLVGSAPYQVPRNADLGTVAFQDANNVSIGGGAVTLGASAATGYFQNTDISDIKPSLMMDFANSKALDPRISFSRASTATYYDGDTTAVAEQNLFTYSQDFTNVAWTKEYATVVSNATTAPDGTLTATSITETTANGDHRAYQLAVYSPTSSYTFSVYAKNNGRRYILLRMANASYNYSVVFDLQSGAYSSALESGYTGSTYSITNVGNGWYRCAVTVSGNVSNQVIALSNTATAAANILYTGDGASGLYIWGAQLEQHSGVAGYVPTTSTTITNYIPVLQTAAAGVPRFDHDPITGESKGLLVEEQRTNVCIYSQQLASLSTNLFNVSTISNATIAPNGTLTAAKIYQSAGTPAYNSIDLCNGTGPFSANQVVTMSIYAKMAEARYIRLAFPYSGAGYIGVQFDLSNGSVVKTDYAAATLTNASATHVGNGWYRCVLTGTLTALSGWSACITPMIVPWTGGYSNYGSYGDGYSGIYAWGAQVELGTNASSYIPTSGAQATRSIDYASMSGSSFSSWFNNAQGTVYSEMIRSANVPAGYVWAMNISNASTNNDQFGLYATTTATLQPYGYAWSLVQYGFPASAAYTPGTTVKTALAYAFNDSAVSYSGSTVATDTQCIIPQCNYLFIGQQFGGNTVLNGWVKKLAYYPLRLSNAELQEMTL